MASSPEFVRYVCEQLAGAGRIRCKRMFGEYGLWCDGVFFATIEDGMLCLKITDAGRALLPGAEIVEPHEGARFLYVAELDDRDFLATLVQAHLRGAHGVEALAAGKDKQTGGGRLYAGLRGRIRGCGRPLSQDASTGGRAKRQKSEGIPYGTDPSGRNRRGAHGGRGGQADDPAHGAGTGGHHHAAGDAAGHSGRQPPPRAMCFPARALRASWAAKRTSELIPMCHPLPIDSVKVELTPLPPDRVRITSTLRCTYKTGVEMEALTAASVAALTVYEMCKAMDRGMRIDEVMLLHKAGGKSGDYTRGE